MHPRRSFRCLPLLVLALILLAPSPVRAQQADPNFWCTNGSVRALARSGSLLYVGGDFSALGPATGGFVSFDNGSSQLPARFPRVNGAVQTIAPDGSGGWYIGGIFTSVGGVARQNLAHVLAAGEFDAGTHAVAIDAAALAPGLYFARLTATGETRTRRVVVTR